MDTNEYKEKASCLFKNLSDKNKTQNFVLGFVELLLPFLFILSLIGCLIIALFSSLAAYGFSASIIAFIIMFVTSVVGVCITFYFIYALKSIKDSLAGQNSFCLSDIAKTKSNDSEDSDIEKAVDVKVPTKSTPKTDSLEEKSEDKKTPVKKRRVITKKEE